MSEATTPLVLVVDDDRDTRELYRLLFEMAGFRSVDAGTVAGALASCASDVPDVALCDWRLPDGDGLALAEALMSVPDARHTALVAVTGLTMSPQLCDEALARGFSKVLQKPVLPDDILSTVEEMIKVSAQRRLRMAAELTQRYAAPVRREAARTQRSGSQLSCAAGAIIDRAATRAPGPLALMVADDDGRYVAASAGAVTLTGYDREDLVSLSVWDLTPVPREANGRELWRQFLSCGTQQGEYALRRRDGHSVEAQYYAVANIAPGLHLSALAPVRAGSQLSFS